MTGTYALGGLGLPWLRFPPRGGPDFAAVAGHWFATMSGHRGHRAPFSPWAGFEGTPPFGPPPFGPHWPGRQRGPKARRGDVRAAILGVLAEKSMNGYQVIQEIAERSGGLWKPSPGSIYPTLQQLEDEGLVRAAEQDGRRAFSLTDEGRAYVRENADEVAAPWQAMGEPAGVEDGFKPLIGQVAAAVWQIVAVGTPSQQAKGREALVELRRRLHAILAQADQAGTDGAEDR